MINIIKINFPLLDPVLCASPPLRYGHPTLFNHGGNSDVTSPLPCLMPMGREHHASYS